MNEKLLLNIFRLIIIIAATSYMFYLWYTIEEFNLILLSTIMICFIPDLNKAFKSFSKSAGTK